MCACSASDTHTTTANVAVDELRDAVDVAAQQIAIQRVLHERLIALEQESSGGGARAHHLAQLRAAVRRLHEQLYDVWYVQTCRFLVQCKCSIEQQSHPLSLPTLRMQYFVRRLCRSVCIA